ncbi:thiopeptide-type bacteriocin biosynthesis protein [Streptomyces sp. NPDC055025]
MAHHDPPHTTTRPGRRGKRPPPPPRPAPRRPARTTSPQRPPRHPHPGRTPRRPRRTGRGGRPARNPPPHRPRRPPHTTPPPSPHLPRSQARTARPRLRHPSARQPLALRHTLRTRPPPQHGPDGTHPLLNHLPHDVDRWFWLRYTTPALGPHLRLRFHGTPHTLATRIQPQLAYLADQLHHRRLLGPAALRLEPYEQEIERYGGPRAITAAEHLFCADSRLALTALTHTDDQRLITPATTTAEIARTLAPDQPRSALNPGHLTRDHRRHRDALRPRLTDHPNTPTELAPARAQHHAALTAYRDVVPHQSAARCASHVIHMHANRVLTSDPGHERIMRTLAADLLHHRR